jgi:hypothetical protein
LLLCLLDLLLSPLVNCQKALMLVIGLLLCLTNLLLSPFVNCQKALMLVIGLLMCLLKLLLSPLAPRLASADAVSLPIPLRTNRAGWCKKR